MNGDEMAKIQVVSNCCEMLELAREFDISDIERMKNNEFFSRFAKFERNLF